MLAITEILPAVMQNVPPAACCSPKLNCLRWGSGGRKKRRRPSYAPSSVVEVTDASPEEDGGMLKELDQTEEVFEEQMMKDIEQKMMKDVKKGGVWG